MFSVTVSGIMNDYPDLTTHGFGVDSGWGDSFEIERAALYDRGLEFEACREWLSMAKRTLFPNRRIGTSYRLKHVVERWYEERYKQPLYVPEGSFIAAAIDLGFAIKRIPRKTSVYVGISSKSL